jgi:hypothetical protein
MFFAIHARAHEKLNSCINKQYWLVLKINRKCGEVGGGRQQCVTSVILLSDTRAAPA